MCRSIVTFSTANSGPLDHRTTASGISMRCIFGRVTVSERGSPGRTGKSPESRHPVHERFQTVPSPWNGPALYVKEHCTGKWRKGRRTNGIGSLAGRAILAGCRNTILLACETPIVRLSGSTGEHSRRMLKKAVQQSRARGRVESNFRKAPNREVQGQAMTL